MAPDILLNRVSGLPGASQATFGTLLRPTRCPRSSSERFWTMLKCFWGPRTMKHAGTTNPVKYLRETESGDLLIQASPLSEHFFSTDHSFQAVFGRDVGHQIEAKAVRSPKVLQINAFLSFWRRVPGRPAGASAARSSPKPSGAQKCSKLMVF